ncbi:MAG: hypothetical protein IT378_12235, partial [Sandaracinaceae bacterium]|nr:hypothetical protein [Sandaracinaceae bacterium]
AAVRERAKLDGEPQAELAALVDLGRVEHRLGHADAADRTWSDARALASTFADPLAAHRIDLLRAMLAVERNDRELAERLYAGAEPVLERAGAFAELSEIRRGRALAAMRRGEPSSEEKLLLEAIDLAERAGDASGLAKAHNNLAIAYTRARRFRDSEQHFLRARELHASLGARTSVAIVELNLGGLYYHELMDLERARAVYQSALRTFEQTGHARGTAAVLTSLGALDLVGARPRDAIAHLDAAIALWTETRDTTHLAYTVHLRAMAGLDAGEPLEPVARAVARHLELTGPVPPPIARVRCAAGALRLAVRDPDARADAVGLIAALDAYSERVGPEDGAAPALLEAARAARTRGEHDLARAWALRALELPDAGPLAPRRELEQLAGLAARSERPN